MARAALAHQLLPVTRLLLVEDNTSDAFLVSGLLEDAGQADYKTCHVKTQSEGVQALAGQTFDVCLLDLTLPDANGFSALIDIQNKAPDMPVLILTGVRDTALAREAVGRGAQDYLLKDELKITALTRSIDYAIERKRMEKALFKRANHDTLTGLANRCTFETHLGAALARAERTGAGIAVLFIDLDRFKPINDLHGHDAGDEALRTVAQRLRKILRAYDTAARFGGDEFAVLLEGIASARDAASIAQKIIVSVGAPISYHGKNLEIGASIGIAFSDVPVVQEQLLQHADVAMYHAKNGGGNAYRFYSQEMHNLTELRLKLEEDLRVAMLAEELRLYYQPCVAPGGDAVLGVEALLRWAHPGRGLLAAGEFMAIAEAGRMMAEMSEWMGSQLRHDIAVWNAQMIQPLEITVNLSASQLDVPGLVDWFAPLVREDFLGSHRLAMEIPEEVLVTLTPARHDTLVRISRMGIGLHLDHFGRGSLSLQTLLSLPFSMLKIDLSIVQAMGDRLEGDVLVNAAIMFAHHLGMKVGAVGVEAPGQMKALEAGKCDAVQGHLTAHPMTAEQLVEWLQ